ncbi:MAG: hypothetical protein J0I32_18345 [Sphingobacteriales bacterium]|nr:hypothetical protein [Sphingobacteriales bacterium]OJV97829.1 MAG: hypothetical protein BGO52_10225 [Sphingobacteriales bacterium 44-61]
MKENNLLASVAVFSALYNQDHYTNISDILAEFIKGAVITESKWTINSTELTNLLEKIYAFKIPESVVRTTVNSRLKKVSKKERGNYVFDSSIANDFKEINQNYDKILVAQKQITDALIAFIESRTNDPLTEEDKNTILQNFKNYILDSGNADKYSKLISAFIIKNKSDLTFAQNFNLIREGVILYQGIKYTADLNELGKWNKELSIFLSTEHLFNALGYNGSLFQQIFDDFYNLVLEINATGKNKHGEKLIELRYFQETKEQVDAFFQTAEYIFKGTSTLDPSKTAMKNILDGCKSISDIKSKRVKFELELKQKGILYKDFSQSVYSYPEYVVEDQQTIDDLKKESDKSQRPFDEQLCRQFMQIFTKINYYRGGESRTKFENIGSILITGNRFALYLAHQTKVKFKEDDIPFAKDIDFITNKFWFKLKKGFGNTQFIPKSFDVITKAQVVLSAQLNQTVSKEFDKLQQQFKDGKLTKEEALERSYVLREKTATPEEITPENLENSLAFLNDDNFFEDYFREKEKRNIDFIEVSAERDKLKEELSKLQEAEKKRVGDAQFAKYNSEREVFSLQKWNEYKTNRWKESGYFLFVCIITILPILITLILKGNKVMNEKIEKLGANQNWIWIGLAVVFLFELLGRSYLFNKERTKSGWHWLRTCLSKSSFLELKVKIFDQLGKDFDNNRSKP